MTTPEQPQPIPEEIRHAISGLLNETLAPPRSRTMSDKETELTSERCEELVAWLEAIKRKELSEDNLLDAAAASDCRLAFVRWANDAADLSACHVLNDKLTTALATAQAERDAAVALLDKVDHDEGDVRVNGSWACTKDCIACARDALRAAPKKEPTRD